MKPFEEKNSDALSLMKIKDILLKEEREKVAHIENELNLLKQNFPAEYQLVVNQLIDEKIKNSQDDIVNAIFPSVGKMIKKYINLQIESLRDSIDEKLKKTFTFTSFIRNIKSSISGVKPSDEIISSLNNYQIEEVYLIQKNSGLLIGSASREKTMDQEVIAGMLTAIKAFVEDAFQKTEEDLESIQYGTYKIILQSFHSYYVAVAVSGTISASQKDELGTRLLNFAEAHLKRLSAQPEAAEIQKISKELKETFLS